MEHSILVVDDDADIRQLLQILLTQQGYRVEAAASGTEALLLLQKNPSYDLLILDIMMPELDGISACKAIRDFSKIPVLFLTAKTQLGDMTAAYESGGDDFLAKPFSQSELLLKVDSLLRRYCVYKGKQQDFANIRLEEDTVYRDGVPVDLTVKELDMLKFFFRNRGIPMDARTLYEGVWGEKYLPSSNNTVMVHIRYLRKKLEKDPANPTLIRTVWGKGYQFG